MSDLESVFCRTRAWRWTARIRVVPRVVRGTLGPRVLEIGCGSGAMAGEVLAGHGEVSAYTATDVDPAMVRLTRKSLEPWLGFVDVRPLGIADAYAFTATR